MSDAKPDLAALRIDRSARARGGPGWWFRLSVVLIAATGGLGAWWLGARWWLGASAVRSVRVASVVERAAVGGGDAVLNASGYVTARRRATVSSKVTGKVIEVLVEEGLAVRAGRVLARLDDTTARASLALAEAQLEAARRAVTESEVRLQEAQRVLARRTALARERIIGQSELDAAQAEVDSLEARIAAAREQVTVAERQVAVRRTELDETIIAAPFSGVVISKDAQPGEMVSPISAGGGFTRTGICTIVDMSSLEIEVDVNESHINRVQSGQPVIAVLDAYSDWRIPARVITTVPAADRQKATVLVRIAFDRLDPRILPDMGVKVTFLRPDGAGQRDERARLMIPRAAVRSAEGSDIVFVIRTDHVERRAIKLGTVETDAVEVVSGLAAGDRVVVEGPADLTDGDRIVVRN